jgi:glycerol uptake facilitator-like aquaporin
MSEDAVNTRRHPPRRRAAFFEGRGPPALARRAAAEGVATTALTMALIFAGQATWLGDLRPLALCLGTPAAVAALSLSFGPATGAHFNPLITASQWLRGQRDTQCLVAYVCAQFAGALVGAALATALIGPTLHFAPASSGLMIGAEIFASAGLMIIVLCASLVLSSHVGVVAVFGWLMMVSLAVPGEPFANPALAVALSLATGSADAQHVLLHITGELLGTALALLVIAVAYPQAAGGGDIVGRLWRRRKPGRPSPETKVSATPSSDG